MKKLFLLILVSCCVYSENLKINMTKEEIIKILTETERRNLPIEIDENAEITNIIAIKEMVIETIEIDSNKNKKIKELIKTEKGKLEIIENYYKRKTINFCNDEKMRMLINNKIIFSGGFIEKTTKESIGYFTLDEEDCLKLGIERKKPSL